MQKTSLDPVYHSESHTCGAERDRERIKELVLQTVLDVFEPLDAVIQFYFDEEAFVPFSG